MTDMKGTILKTGDIMFEATGSGAWGGKSYTLVTLWAVPPEEERDGRGIRYTAFGEKSHFYWTRASNATKLIIEKLPEEFVFAFKHGLHKVEIETHLMTLGVYEAIKQSDWKKRALTPETVAKLKILSTIEITSFSDIADKWDILFSSSTIPRNVSMQILQLFGYKQRPIVNGELGIAMYDIQCHFIELYVMLKEWKSAGCLLEKCKELDNRNEV